MISGERGNIMDCMGQTIHMSISVRGMLNWPKGEFKKACKWITKKDGTPFTPAELKEALYDELAKGHEVIPMGECDNFDHKTGCRGHGEPA
jgi:hypothetical protein